MKTAVICSSGGSAFFAAFHMLRDCGVLVNHDVLILTDRECSAEITARDNGIETRRISTVENNEFSQIAAKNIIQSDCSCCLLLFSRLITSSLFDRIPTFNVHPSILPAYKGFRAIERAFQDGATMMGATLHEVDESVDSGKIIAQVASPVRAGSNIEILKRISFVQKVYLVVFLFDMLSCGRSERVTPSAAPAITSPALISAFQRLLASRPETILIP